MRVVMLVLFALLAPGAAQAETRAWLDRDRIVLGESATLNVETDQATVSAPSYDALRGDFRLSGHSSRRSLERRNGRTVSRSLFAVALEPRRAGVIGIPALSVDGERTSPITLTVLPPDAAAAPARAGETVFIETEVDDTAPYVQQSVGVVVRLHHAVPLVSGELDVQAPDGATLRRVGEDVQYTRELAGRRYSVLERRFLLIPERSGPLVLPGAVFEGRGIGGFFDDLFGDGVGDRLQASGRAPAHCASPVRHWPGGTCRPMQRAPRRCRRSNWRWRKGRARSQRRRQARPLADRMSARPATTTTSATRPAGSACPACRAKPGHGPWSRWGSRCSGW